MTRIVWTESAVSDLDSIHAYMARDSEVYAGAVIAEIFDSVDRLAHFPRLVPEMDDYNTRELIVGNYRVIYDASGEYVHILSVLHGARLFPKPLRTDKKEYRWA